MPESAWIVPAIAAIGVPLLVSWLRDAVKKGDEAQQRVIEQLQADQRRIEAELACKADSQHIDAVLVEVRNVGAKVQTLNDLVLVELGKRPTRDEMVNYVSTLRQGPHN
jgi:hypothetical protein